MTAKFLLRTEKDPVTVEDVIAYSFQGQFFLLKTQDGSQIWLANDAVSWIKVTN